MSNTDLWDRLGKTDPKQTKTFKRAGGFSGTAIKPMWSFRRMTEEFGPCGQGWGINQPTFQVVPGTDGETLVYCIVSVWHGDRANVVFGVGGDKAIVKFKSGLSSDDEAFKKAFTDAITNALKLIGVGADVHMGLFDDSKYVNDLKNELAAKEDPDSATLYITQCLSKIEIFMDAKALRDWWASEKTARRDFDLTKAEVNSLMAKVVTKLELLEGKKAA